MTEEEKALDAIFKECWKLRDDGPVTPWNIDNYRDALCARLSGTTSLLKGRSDEA